MQEDYDRDMTEKYGPDRALWPSFDEDVWYSNTDNNAHGDNYGLGALGKIYILKIVNLYLNL